MSSTTSREPLFSRRTLFDTAVVLFVLGIAATLGLLSRPRRGEPLLSAVPYFRDIPAATDPETGRNYRIDCFEVFRRDYRVGSPLRSYPNTTDHRWGAAILLVWEKPMFLLSHSHSADGRRITGERLYGEDDTLDIRLSFSFDILADDPNTLIYTDTDGNVRKYVVEGADPFLDETLDTWVQSNFGPTPEGLLAFWKELQRYNDRSEILSTRTPKD